ncbi:Conserved_hypothetical protein [Hexamita inflata]|uniref:Uncharacterized protein n=1 Tax=Hexamita inflata TaxID=28002 RepID=A0AA86QVF3_9EUKA|nr:Conserved hypothetical protein [Hexamita inflata]
MNYFAITLLKTVSSSFSECFSAKSYLSGSASTYELTLHLLPFERLNQITSENLCKMYLPGKPVIVQLHFDDISFPRSGEDEISFEYKFNAEIQVSFQLSETDYLHIADKQHAMFELWYDVNLVKVNNSVNSIEHTKFNGTGCFKRAEMEYTIYGDIDITVIPNNCKVTLDANLEVYMEFHGGEANEQIPILPCTSGCQPNEYQLSSSSFEEVKLYRVKKATADAAKLQSFYKHFVDNRLLPVSMNLRYKTNGLNSVISRQFDNKTAKDTWGCTSDPHLLLATTLNPNNMFVQFRDSLTNKMTCDTQNATHVRVDDYVMDGSISTRLQRMVDLEKYNQQIGVTFDISLELTQLRDNYSSNTMSLIVVSYLDANGLILWEILRVGFAYLGCISKATMHIHEDHACISYQFDSKKECMSQFIPASGKNTLGIFYKENGITHQLSFYSFHYDLDYSILKQSHCFRCEDYEDKSNGNHTCAENQEITKQKLKSAIVGFGVISKFDSIILETVVSECLTIFVPFIVAISVLVLAVVIYVSSIISKKLR